MNHIWRPLVEKAGYLMEDLPKTWDAYYDFFKQYEKFRQRVAAANDSKGHEDPFPRQG